ncbi:MAG: hypothetical protein RLY71_3780 [Pseudomonadota bacterium]|jgi:hypothetical protein
MSRPRGTFGVVAQALLNAARQQPGTVRQLACRAQVGYATARYAASRLQALGALVPQGDQRPQVLGIPQVNAGQAITDLQSCLSGWMRPAPADDMQRQIGGAA